MVKYVLLAGAAAGSLVLAAVPTVAAAQAPVAQGADQAAAEIVVTARRVEENLQKVPLSISVVSADELRRRDVADFVGLSQIAPSLTAYSPYRDNFFVVIRGLGGSSRGTTPAVESYFNEVPLPPSRNFGAGGGGPGAFFDLASVQVLNGPQGTLFGRNTLGGAVLFTSQRPTNKLEGYIEAGYGNYNNSEISGVLNVPIVDDKLLVRLAASGRRRDGFTHVASIPGKPNGSDLDSTRYGVGRLSVTFKPTEKIKNEFIAEISSSDNSSPSNILKYVAPNSVALQLFPGLLEILEQQEKLGPRNQAALGVNPGSRKDTLAIVNITQVDLSDTLRLKNIVSFTRAKNAQVIDADGSPYGVLDLAQAIEPFVSAQYTEELQLQGESFGGKLTWTAGGFYLKNPVPDYLESLYVTFGAPSLTVTRFGGNSKALYAQGIYALTDKLNATVGARYTWDYAISQQRNLSPAGACVAPPVTADADCTTTRDGKFSAPTWALGLDYAVTPDTLLYATARRGYRTGGFNLTVTDPALYKFAPEYLMDFEVGAKSTWSLPGGMSGRANLAIFHHKYTDIQLFQTVVNGINTSTYTANGGDARAWGAEFEGALYPARNLELSANFAWLDFKYTRFGPQVPVATTLAQETQGRPKYKYGFGARYHLPVSNDVGRISISANWNWTAENGDSSIPFGVRPAYGILNLSADWRNIAGSRFSALFYATNATDKVYAIGGYPLLSLGTSTVTYGEPRMYGLRLRYDF